MDSRAVSLITPQGTAKAPSQFFLPKKLTAVFTPTPESPWARVVVGSRTRRIPRWAMAAALDDVALTNALVGANDRIELRGIRVFGRHGANPGERHVPQPFDVDVILDVDVAAARASDALADTVDYAQLHATIVRLFKTTSYDLLERLGQVVLDAILLDARVVQAQISIGKPHLLAGATPVVTLRQAR